MKVYIIHENDEWTSHLVKRLEELNIPYESWHLDKGIINLKEKPPVGVFYNRMSASSHTRGHRYSPELTNVVLNWLEFHKRKVINGSNALSLEIDKTKQYLNLELHGIKTPKTIAAVGSKSEIMNAAKELNIFPFITKHNRAGKGLGVFKFNNIDELYFHLNSSEFEKSIDGITLIQEYIKPKIPFIYRSEFINSKHLYTVRVDSSSGFELCPADGCMVGDLYCPVGESPETLTKFTIVENSDKHLIKKYEEFLKNTKIDVAGIEFIIGEFGDLYTYDVNTNTNYNSDAEAKESIFAMLELAKYLGKELENLNATDMQLEIKNISIGDDK
ncbi:MAG: hypothetical protein FWF57_01665 [Defluviitaleaceae bacterium]|nr:hypothetical protein [Defluviitaleaceae bacterium]